MTTKQFNAHVYATVRISLANAGRYGNSPEEIADAVADAIAGDDRWLNNAAGVTLSCKGRYFPVIGTHAADEITHVLVDELEGEAIVEHHFDYPRPPISAST